MSEAAAVAATPSNFDAHLASVDMSGPDDGGGSTQVRDSTGPSNDNAMSRDSSGWPDAQKGAQPEQDGPEFRVGDDGQPLQLDENGMEAQPEPEQGDEQTPEGMPAYEELQGMYKALSGPELHQGLWDKTVPVTINGTQVQKPISELAQGYMRMADFSRKSQEASQWTNQAKQVIEQNRQLLSRMADPAVLRASLKRLGPQHERAFQEAAKQYAAEQLQLLRMNPHERAAYEAQQKAAEYERQLQEMREQYQREQEQRREPEHQKYVAPIHNMLMQTVPQLWAKHGVRESPIAMQTFAQHIQAIWDGREETVQQALEQATIATAEELGDRVAQHRQHSQQQPPQRLQQPIAPSRVPSGPPQRNGQRQAPAGARVTSFDDHLRGLR